VADDPVVGQFCCAACGARLRFVKALTPGRRMWCPNCYAPLVLASAPERPAADDPPAPVPTAKEESRPGPPAVPAEAPPKFPRPRRTRPKNISRGRALATGLAVVGGFLLLIGAAILIMAASGVFDAGRR
jgi:hypothetical protein